MKRLLLLALLVPVFAFGQYSNVTGYFKTQRLGTEILNKAYVGTTRDTTQSINPWAYNAAMIALQSKDSVSLTVLVQYSIDGVTWDTTVTVDSLSNGNNNGDYKEINVSTFGNPGAYAERFIFVVNPGYRLGTSSATYTARYILKRY
jgi:hypothetical protein